LVPPWDLEVVLDQLNAHPFEPLQSASLKSLTLKTLFLVAVASSARVSELASLDVRPPFTVVRDTFVSLMHREGFKPKVPSSANINRTIILEAINTLSCPVRALNQYLSVTEKLRRPPCTQLFVSFAPGREGKAVQKNSISSWLVQAISLAYQQLGRPLPKVVAHSTRKIATSKAWAAGASCEEICNAATWSSASTFAQFYKLDVLPTRLSSISSKVLVSSVPDHQISDSDDSD
jgi:hypothetical protein